MAAEFVHLHVHSEFSMLDGAIRIPQLVEHVDKMGMSAVALTDNGNMFGAVQLVRTCERSRVKAILGCEVNFTAADRRDPQNRELNHLVLLAASQEGYQNLVRLVSAGWVDGTAAYEQPRIDFEILQRHSKGVVGLSACMGGHVAQEILNKGPAAGREALAKLRDSFDPGYFFVELQDHGFPENRPLNQVLTGLASDLALPLVGTNDCHYLERQSAHAQLVLQCIGSGRSVREMEAVHHHSSELYLKTPEQMVNLFAHIPEAAKNTLRIAEMCAGQATPLAEPNLPRFNVPGGATEEDYLRALSVAGLGRRIQEMRERREILDENEYHARLELELDVILKMGFAGYFLIVQDFINWAKDNGVPVGPGRGSGAGSLVAWSLRITDLNPITHGLLFERFLNPERVSMPDFDIDFCMDQRDRVIQYVRDKYGQASVGQIATFHQLKSRSVVRDVGRVMGMTPGEAGLIATMIPEPVGGKSVPISDALDQEPRLKSAYQTDEQARELLDTAQALENLTRHAGMHAAGVVISEGPIWDHVPVFCPEEGVYVTQYHKDDVEAAGLVKFDFLGLRTLTVIDIATKLIDRRPDRQGEPFRIDQIHMDDDATYALLQSGETTNVFQLESSGMQSLFKQLRPDRFDDIVAAVALYRPGPMGAQMDKDFVHRKHGRQKVEYPHPSLAGILEETRGVIVYQEQVMQIAQEMAGYSLGGADLLRRAMGKKKASEMDKQKAIFIEGATGRGHSRDKAEEVFDLMAYFAGYGFNKSHSAAYALITYQTAYLKTHYPVEFSCATLTADKEKIDKVVRTVAEARSMGITVLPPDVNESEIEFTVVYTPDDAQDIARLRHKPVCYNGEVHDPMGPKIRFGLGAIKGVGTGAVEAILEARQAGSDESGETHERPFVDLFDFCARVDLRRVNKSVIEALVQCGAFDTVHNAIDVHRSQAFVAIEQAVERGKRIQAERSSGQESLFGLMGGEDDAQAYEHPGGSFPVLDPWDSREQLSREKGTLGFYVSGHPLDRYRSELLRFCDATTESIARLDNNRQVTVGGTVEGYRERRTKMGHTMAFFHIEDALGRVEVIVRPKPLESTGLREALKSGQPILLTGRVKHEVDRNDDTATPEAKILLEEATLLSDALHARTTSVTVRLPVESIDRTKLDSLRSMLEQYPGPCPVSLELSSPGDWRVNLSETGLFVDPTDALLTSLERLFGSKVCELH
ncbi:MAG: DNA polymerase III subunit alpha [Deltaproteobacteria bacterium]|jgi:DNA polymerase-3 subunit alpha|nr:DNA polymerase III subunit alpha [Deltaproteobacteria bacterium]